MGLFDFMKDAGDREGMKKEGMDDEAMGELRTSNTIVRKILGSGITVDDLNVEFDDGVATVRGRVADDATREKVILIAGNTPGVARVDDQLRGGGGNVGAGFYTVEKGDTLSGIAEDRLGDASRWKEIFEANKPMLDDPDKIYPGQVLRIPA